MSLSLTTNEQRSVRPSSAERTQRIRAAIRKADRQLLRKRPWLGRDDLVAMVFFAATIAWAVATALAWMFGILNTPLTIGFIALALSVLHELEHDLIHDLYLSRPWLRIGVLTTIWIAKASLDPWSRGRLHRWHHAASGQADDIEERLIGLGLPWGPWRLLITLFAPASLFLGPAIMRSVIERGRKGGGRPNLRAPRGWWLVHSVTSLLAAVPFVAVVGVWIGVSWAWPLLVLWAFPNMIRHSAIAFMSANSHYVDIERNVLVEQNQILDHPFFWPLQLFCWNFGATHVLHHFWVRQPFWRRTLVFPQVRSTLITHGVVANDLGTFGRANRRPQLV